MTPRMIRGYVKADMLRKERVDQDAWLYGAYNHNAVLAAIDRGFNGKKSTMTYLDCPFSEKEYKLKESGPDETYVDEDNPENTVLNKKDKQKVDLLFASLNVMKTNWELEHKNKTEADSVS